MLARTQQILEDLSRTDWFSRVGVVDTAAAKVVNSWPEAIALCSTIDWENFVLDRANDFRVRLRATSVSDYDRWNEVARPLSKVVVPMVYAKTRDVVLQWRLPQEFVQRVGWDVIHMAIESEYSEICPPGFLAVQGAWYLNGHFPCGWEGRFPNGIPIVY